MGTMKVTIPNDVAEAFNKAFDGEDKSAVVADQMRRAVAEQVCRIEARGRVVTDEEIQRARQELRE